MHYTWYCRPGQTYTTISTTFSIFLRHSARGSSIGRLEETSHNLCWPTLTLQDISPFRSSLRSLFRPAKFLHPPSLFSPEHLACPLSTRRKLVDFEGIEKHAFLLLFQFFFIFFPLCIVKWVGNGGVRTLPPAKCQSLQGKVAHTPRCPLRLRAQT